MIPDGWSVQTIDDIAKVSSGGTPSRNNPSYWGGDVPWVTTTEVQNCEIHESDVREYISEKGLNNSSAKIFPKNTILLALIGQGKTRGQVALLRFPATTNQNCAGIILNKGNDPDFYFNYLLSKYEVIRRLSNNAGQSNLSGKLVKSIKVPVPPTKEQTKIANILTTWDKAIETVENLIENSRAQKKALMQQIFKEDSKWNNFNLGDVCTFQRGKELSKEKVAPEGKFMCVLYGELYTVYEEIIHVIKSRTNYDEGVLSESGDVLIPSSTTTSGIDLANATSIKEDNVKLGGDIIILRTKKNTVDPDFLAYYLTHHKKHEIARLTQGITIIHLYGKDLKFLKISLPSLTHQRNVAELLINLDNQRLALQHQLGKFKEEKKAIMQQLLTGKRRVSLLKGAN